MQNVIVASQQLLPVLLGRIRLLRIVETLTQLLNRRRRRFHPYWTFPRPVESWFEIHMQQCNFTEAFFRRHLRHSLSLSDLSPRGSISKWREWCHVHNTILLASVTKYDDLLKGICERTIDFLARQKIVGLQS